MSLLENPLLFTYEFHYKTVNKRLQYSKNQNYIYLSYKITFYDFSYIKYKYEIFISDKIVLKKITIRESTISIKKLSGKYFIKKK